MSAKRETTFYKGVNKHVPDSIYRMKLYNPLMGGPPDFYYEGSGSLWVEYKFNELPKRDSTEVGMLLSELQDEWLTRAYKNGQQTLVIVGVSLGRGAQGYVFNSPSEWQAMMPASALRAKLLDQQSIANIITGILA